MNDIICESLISSMVRSTRYEGYDLPKEDPKKQNCGTVFDNTGKIRVIIIKFV